MRWRRAPRSSAIATTYDVPISISHAKCRADEQTVVCPEFETSGHSEHVAFWESELDAKSITFEGAKSWSKSDTKHEPRECTKHTAYASAQ